MTYTEEAKQALSRKVAEKLGITMYRFVGKDLDTLWLHDDWHTIMELCVKHRITGKHVPSVYAYNFKIDSFIIDDECSRHFIRVLYADHNNDPPEAERIARLLALGEVSL